jgi:hypothetical protein
VDEFNNPGEDGGIRLRRDTVPQVDHVPGSCRARGYDITNVRFEDFPGGRQQGGVDVSLQRHRAAQPAVRFVEREPVVHAHHIHPYVAHGHQEL